MSKILKISGLLFRKILKFSSISDAAVHSGHSRVYLSNRASNGMSFSQGRYFITKDESKAEHILKIHPRLSISKARKIKSIRVFNDSSETVGIFSKTSELCHTFKIDKNNVIGIISKTLTENAHRIKFPKNPGLYLDVIFIEE